MKIEKRHRRNKGEGGGQGPPQVAFVPQNFKKAPIAANLGADRRPKIFYFFSKFQIFIYLILYRKIL